MASMSYCRHQNVVNDLQDIIENWVEDPEAEDLSPEETEARGYIIEQCKDILNLAANSPDADKFDLKEWTP